MSRYAQRSRAAAGALFLTGAVALAAAACSSQGTTTAAGPAATSAAAGTVTTSGSASGSAPASSAATDSAASPSSSAASSDNAASSVSSSSAPAAATSTTTANSFTPTNKLTDTVTFGGFKVKIHSVVLPYTPPADQFFKPSDTETWMMIDLEATNVTSGTIGISAPTAFTVYNFEKSKYLSSTVGEPTKDKQFPSGDVKAGQTVSGQLVFIMPKQGAKGLLLKVDGNLFKRDYDKQAPLIDLGH